MKVTLCMVYTNHESTLETCMGVEQKTLSHTKAVHKKNLFPVQRVAIILARRAILFIFFFLLVGKILSIFG